MSGMPENRTRALLDERTLALSRRGLSQVASGATRPYLLCRVGGEHVALALSETWGVIANLPLTPIPAAPRALLGMVALPDAIVNVLDLALALGFDSATDHDGQGHIVMLRGRNGAVALSVERALGVSHVEVARIEQPRASPMAGNLAAEARAARLPHPYSTVLGIEAVSGYAPRGSGSAIGIEDGFCIVDLTRLLRRYMP